MDATGSSMQRQPIAVSSLNVRSCGASTVTSTTNAATSLELDRRAAYVIRNGKIDDGTLVVKSGQTDIAQTATQGWKAENAQSRMDSLMTANYADGSIDGVLSPNDTLARANTQMVLRAQQAKAQLGDPERVDQVAAALHEALDAAEIGRAHV